MSHFRQAIFVSCTQEAAQKQITEMCFALLASVCWPGKLVVIVTAAGWTDRRLNSGGGEIFLTFPDRH